MHPVAKLVLGSGAAILATALVWRHAVRRFVLPCPTRFAWALENPIMERVAGSAAIPDRRAALVELATALKPGGILSITEVRLDPHYQRPRVVRRLASEAGLVPAGFFGGLLAYTANFAKPEPAA